MLVTDPSRLVSNLLEKGKENEWLEFKENNFSADSLAKYISGLANSAMLAQKRHAYILYGIKDKTLEIVGTSVDLSSESQGSEPLKKWLSKVIRPRLNIEFCTAWFDDLRVEVVLIDAEMLSPVQYNGKSYIRIGESLSPLSTYPEKERSLWSATSRYSFEGSVCCGNLSIAEIFNLFDVESFCSMLDCVRASHEAYIDYLVGLDLISEDIEGGFSVTNLFALLSAKNVKHFPALKGKTPRLIKYKGKNKLVAEDDVIGARGYAIAFPRLLSAIMQRLPHEEEMKHGVRRVKHAIPELAVREFLANALVHQDFSESGSRPTIEIFEDRLVITNPGVPLINTDRFIDAPPKSRNESLADMMRLAKLCENRGSGVDRALVSIEKSYLPAPMFQVVEGATVVTIYCKKAYAKMTSHDRLRACYQHACLRWEASEYLTNMSLRKRLGLSDSQISQVSRLIAEAVEARLIRPLADDQPKKNAKYVPIWVE